MSIALLCLNGLLIASLYAIGRVAGELGAAPVSLLAWQVASSAIVVTALAGWRGEAPPLSRRHLRYYLVAGLLGVTVPTLASYLALLHLPAGLIGLLGSLSAVFTYAIARRLRMEPESCVRKVGLGVALVGMAAILLPRGALPTAGSWPWILVAALAPVSLAAGNIYRTRAWPEALPPLAAAGGMLLTQALLLLPLSAAFGSAAAPEALPRALGSGLLALTAIGSTVYIGSFLLQRIASPVIVSQQGFVITLGSLAIGIAILGERYSGWVWSGVALVLAGVYLVTRRPLIPPCKASAVD